jgi:hypothetical protein
MNLKLTSTFEDYFEFEGNVLNLDMSFDNILLMFEMFDDDDLEDYDKILLALKMMIYECEEYLAETDFEVLKDIFKYILKEFVGIDLDKEDEEEEPEEKQPDTGAENDEEQDPEKPIKFVDYKKDAGIIYASFLASYGIDLFELQGKLHWRKFKELFTHLPDDSKLKQVIGYRTAKIPVGKNVDQEQVKQLRKLKRIYSLDDEPRKQTSEERNRAFDSLAEAMKKRAKIKPKTN